MTPTPHAPGRRLPLLARRLRHALPEGGSLPADAWRRRHRAVLALLWLHAAALPAYAIVSGYTVGHSLFEALPIVLPAILAARESNRRKLRAVIATFGLLSASGVLVHLSGGYIEAHFHFFVMLGVIALYQDWVPFLFAIGFVVIHHGTLGVFEPHDVYNHSGAWANPWKWALIHGAFVMGASIASLIAWRMAEQYRARSALILASAAEGIYGLDLRGKTTFVNPAAARMLGWTVEELVGRAQHDLIHHSRADGTRYPREECPILATLRDGAEHRVEGEVFWRRDGSSIPVDYVSSPILERGRIVGAVVTFRDVTRRKALEEQLTHQALHDPLTGLANRVLFRDRVEHALARRRTGGRSLAVLFLDLDNFKTVNDSLGHALGDQLLVAVAERLRTLLRPADTAARLGGDEFAILLDDLTSPRDASAVAERITSAFQAPISLSGKEVFTSASIGIAMDSVESDGVDALLRNADLSMYMAKSRGKGSHVIFEPAMHAEALERLELEAELRKALKRNELTLHYQPTVTLGARRIVGVEALVRWNHPTRGLLLPAAFIPMAEETGLIVELGRIVLEQACRQGARWQADFPADPPLTMSVNVSGRQLHHPGFVEEVADVLRTSGMKPDALILEITETVLVRHSDEVVARLLALKELGVQLAIDDFGTEYSSIGYLRRFPIDILKIDKDFVDGSSQGGQDAALLRTIVKLGRSLGLRTVAEGIELAEQARHLENLSCDLGQGFYFAKPLAGEAIAGLLASGSISERPAA